MAGCSLSKLKDYQLRRRSTNTSFSTSLLTDAATKRLSASSQKWRHRSLQINSKPYADDPGIPSPTTTVASPTSMHERYVRRHDNNESDAHRVNLYSDLQGYPSPPLSRPPVCMTTSFVILYSFLFTCATCIDIVLRYRVCPTHTHCINTNPVIIKTSTTTQTFTTTRSPATISILLSS